MQQVASESCNFHVNLRGMSQRSNSRRKQCATEQALWNHTNFRKSQTMYYIYNYVYIYIYKYMNMSYSIIDMINMCVCVSFCTWLLHCTWISPVLAARHVRLGASNEGPRRQTQMSTCHQYEFQVMQEFLYPFHSNDIFTKYMPRLCRREDILLSMWVWAKNSQNGPTLVKIKIADRIW